MDPVVAEVEKIKEDFQETYTQTRKHIYSIQEYGKTLRIDKTEEEGSKESLPRINGLVQDGLKMMQSLQFRLDLLAPQMPSVEDAEKAQSLAHSWKNQIQSLRMDIRNANLQAKANMKKAVQQERELLLGGGEESTTRRRNLQTKTGMTSAAESITESLRRTRQLMVQEVERSASTLMTFEESTGVLRKAESEYKGQRSLLSRTRNLLSTMQRRDVIDRLIMFLGFLIFSLAVLYVVSKRIGLFKLQRKVVQAVKAGMAGGEEILPMNGMNVAPVHPELNVYGLSRLIGEVYFKSYSGLPKSQQIEWNNRAMSTIHAIFTMTASLYFVFWSDLFSKDDGVGPITLRRSRLSSFTLGVSAGYFFSDIGMIIWLYPSLGGMEYVIHHLLSVIGVSYAMLTGEAQVYAYMILISEATTPWINLRWYLDEAGMKNSHLYLMNGIMIFLAWLVARIILFVYLFYHIYEHYGQVMQIHTTGAALVLVVPPIISVMNLIWFGKIFKGLKKTIAKKKSQ
ncbi:hypothetical protein F511_12085 [Dorcoceras hygrometricum]|uniref:TLC domain-containing protein n=1 Tax=Dorcoceras hygrometricum TaxID=472368 RepID=A0A2Z7A5A7_9LAMI|nr:hypothetical protein F511_12085 [Dorcoceras hygrometricum]